MKTVLNRFLAELELATRKPWGSYWISIAHLGLLACAQIDSLPSLKTTPSDLVEETILEAHRGFEQFGGKTEQEFVIWLRGILVRRGLLATFDT